MSQSPPSKPARTPAKRPFYQRPHTGKISLATTPSASMSRSHPSTEPSKQSFRNGLQLLLAVAALSLATVLWCAGRYTVVSPGAARTLFFAALVGGLVSLVAALWWRLRPLPILLGGLSGLAAAVAAALFAIALSAPPEPPIERYVAEAPTPRFDTEAEAAAAAADRHLRVLQWNVEQDDVGRDSAKERTAALVSLLQQSDADVFVLQGLPSLHGREPVAKTLAITLGFDAVSTRASGSRRLLGLEQGIAVLSRFPIRSTERLTLTPNAGALEPRVGLLVEIGGPRGAFSVLGLQLDPRESAVAEAQARTLLEELEARSSELANAPTNMPLLIAGDFNLEAGSDALHAFERAGYLQLAGAGGSGGGSVGVGVGDHLLVREEAGWQKLWGETRLAAGPSQAVRGSDRPFLIAELEPVGPPVTSGWRGSWSDNSTPALEIEQQGLDQERFAHALAQISELDGVECILVARAGRLLADVYLRGTRPGALRNVKSASKSVLSAVVGSAVERDELELDDPVSRYLSAARELDDPVKRSITVQDLLGMRSGLESTSFGNYSSWVSTRNWVASALARPLVDQPGTRRRYSTGDTHLLSAMVTAATGTSTLAYAEQHLFRPLGITRLSWQRDPQGVHFGGNNLSLAARDLARFGQLYLDRGRFGDQQIISHDWVRRSTRAQGTTQSGEWGRYGWLWWLRPPHERGAFSANGFGGQYLYISPAHELLVVIGSTEVSKGRDWRRDLFEQIVDGIAGSMEQAEGPLAGIPLR